MSMHVAAGGVHVEFATLSRQGSRNWNEDACGCWTSGRGACFIVSDGAGGHGGGDIASETAVKTLLSAFSAKPALERTHIEGLLHKTDEAIKYAQSLSDTLHQMSATVAALFFDADAKLAQWISLGDTRLYHFRRRNCQQLTKDHSVVQNYVDAGVISEDRMRGHPERNLLLAALGMSEGVQPAALEKPFAVEDGDAFLLCTDGFWESVLENEMISTKLQAASAEEWLVRMEQIIVKRDAPQQDNYSALAVWVGSPNQVTLPWLELEQIA